MIRLMSLCMQVFGDPSLLADGTWLYNWLLVYVNLSFALDAACNSSRNASRGNAGQLMYAGMRHPVMPQQLSCVAGLNSLEWVVIARTGQEYSAKEQQRARQHAVSVGIRKSIHLEFACLPMMMLRTFSCFIFCIMLVV